MSEYHSRDDTKRRILIAIHKYGGQRVTRLQIARGVNLTKSPYLLGLIGELVDAGYLEEIDVKTRPDQTAKAYNLTEKSIAMLKSKKPN